MRNGILTTTLAALMTTVLIYGHTVAAAEIDSSAGHDYVVKSGDGLYSLGRKFFGQGVAYKKIVKAHNQKAQSDQRYQPIDGNTELEVGQLIWIPAGSINKAPVDATSREAADNAKINAKVTVNSKETILIKVPVDNCEIRVWYNYQLVAIPRLNQKWQQQGMGLIERAKKAFAIRHNARVDGRYMMADKFEVAALRDRDNKKYGNPDGPTFEHMVVFAKENGFKGDDVYKGIIESSGHTSPVYKSTCMKSQ